MIVKEFFRTRRDGVNLYRTYSDAGLLIRKVGTEEVYEEAIDVENAPYVYEEYAEPTEDPEDTEPGLNDTEQPMTRAQLTAKVKELDEALTMILEGVTE